MMETDILTIILAVLGSSAVTALITTLGKRKTDQASVNQMLLENARKDIEQIRKDNSDLRNRVCELEKKIGTLKSDVEDREILLRIADRENRELRSKVEKLEKELGAKNAQIEAMEGRIRELEKTLGKLKGENGK